MVKQIELYFFLFILAGCVTEYRQNDQGKFTPGQIWPDDQGVHINAHGGGILYFNDKYYWFGEHKTEGKGGNRANVGVHVYSSENLYDWKDEGIALEVSGDTASLIAKGCIIERPKVIYNKKTRKFVMWFHHELVGQGYNAAMTGLAIADEVTGPYHYVKSLRPNAGKWALNMTEKEKMDTTSAKAFKSWSKEWKEAVNGGMFNRRDYEGGQMARDMTLFVDDDGQAYHIASAEENLTLNISELTEDYMGFTGRFIRVFPGGHNEAPAVFKKGGQYFMITSGCTGWEPNAARSAVANEMLGEWKELGNPCRGTEDENKTTFHSQSTYIIPVGGKEDAFIFMGDRWMPNNAIDGRYIWLPIEWEDGKPILRWYNEWDLSVFDQDRS